MLTSVCVGVGRGGATGPVAISIGDLPATGAATRDGDGRRGRTPTGTWLAHAGRASGCVRGADCAARPWCVDSPTASQLTLETSIRSGAAPWSLRLPPRAQRHLDRVDAAKAAAAMVQLGQEDPGGRAPVCTPSAARARPHCCRLPAVLLLMGRAPLAAVGRRDSHRRRLRSRRQRQRAKRASAAPSIGCATQTLLGRAREDRWVADAVPLFSRWAIACGP